MSEFFTKFTRHPDDRLNGQNRKRSMPEKESISSIDKLQADKHEISSGNQSCSTQAGDEKNNQQENLQGETLESLFTEPHPSAYED